LNEEQTRKAGSVLKVLGSEWRDLVAGREGFLVERKRAGLLRHKVVWGEMDRMVCWFSEFFSWCGGWWEHFGGGVEGR
jgi:hypothetical protein